jgi:hypothetical protein
MPERAVMVWIESGAGKIARGEADRVTTEGLQVRLREEPGLAKGEEVAVRVCFDRNAPTVATTACVVFLRAVGDAVACGLRWTAPAGQRADLDAWLAHAA